MSAPLPPPDPGRPPGATRRTGGPALNLLLSCALGGMVLLSLAVNHTTESAMSANLMTNELWVGKFAAVSTIGGLASAVDAPGNDVFLGDPDPALRFQMRQAYDSFMVRAEVLKLTLPVGLTTHDSILMVADLDRLLLTMPIVRADAESVFAALARKDARLATRHMAQMDRGYAATLAGVRTLRGDLTAAQDVLLHAERADADSASRLLRLAGLGVLLLAIGGGWLGFRLAAEAERQAAERDQTMTLVVKAQADLEEAHARLTAAHQELESFSYSVAHDLRAPLRSIHGFSEALEQDAGGALDETGRGHLDRIRAASLRMAALIDDLLRLSRVSRQTLIVAPLDLSAMAQEIVADLRTAEPGRQVAVEVTPGILADADPALARVLLQNLLGNAWKFTRHTPEARIAFTLERPDRWLPPVFIVQDNGAGFDMKYASKLFGAFQRMHTASEFEGTGVGLATVQRIVHRHGGRVWAESAVNQGTTFRFTLRR